MRKVTLNRGPSTDAGTFGAWISDSGFQCVTGELPDRNNEPGLSCVPAGIYLVEWDYSQKHGWCYHLRNVPHRFAIEIHAANVMGDQTKTNPDTGKPYKCELEGCIAPGTEFGILYNQTAIKHSGAALSALQDDLNQEPFELLILENSLPPYDFG